LTVTEFWSAVYCAAKVEVPVEQDREGLFVQIPNASQSSVAAWDSIAAITLLNVIEDEFQISMDLELAGDLDSFSKIYEYLKTTAVNA
jgi:acyl carrier protein